MRFHAISAQNPQSKAFLNLNWWQNMVPPGKSVGKSKHYINGLEPNLEL
jgi:homoserine acetyltransferase